MSKIFQKYVVLLSIGLLCLLPLTAGCGWFASKPKIEPITETVEQDNIEPMDSEISTPPIKEDVVEPAPEVTSEKVKDVEPEPVVPKPIVLEPVAPKPVVIKEPEIVPAPKPVVVEVKEPEAPAGVRTTELIDQDSPVDQTPPVDTDSPVNEKSPVQGGGWTLSLLRWIPIAILVLQEDDEMPEEDELEIPPSRPPMGLGQRQERIGQRERGQGGRQGNPGGMQRPPTQQEDEPQGNAPQRNGQGPPNGRGSERPAPPPAPSVVQTPRSEPAEKIRFSFRYAPWKDVIEWFADQAGMSLQAAEKMPTGTFNLSDSDYYTPTEGLDILNGCLQFKDYSLIRKGKTLFVVYLPDKIPANLLETITVEELESRGKYEICRVLFSLNRTTPEIIQAEIERLLGPQGDIFPMPKSQQIAITETGGTLRAIRDIIKRVDDPESASTGPFQAVALKNLTAEEALQMMRTLLAIDATDVSLRTVADSAGKKVFLSGRGDMIERAKEVLTQIDTSFGSDDLTMAGQPQFETHDVGSADPTSVFAVLQTLLAGIPDVRLSLDPKTNGILVRGRPAVQATVRESIKQMQLNAPQVVIIPLKRMSPVTAVETIKKFYLTYSPLATTTTAGGGIAGQQGGGGGRAPQQTTVSSSQAPTVEADTLARQIIVRGTLTQITEIRSLLTQLGEDGTAAPQTNVSTVRTIPLSPTATTLVLEQLQTILPKLDPSMKVNIPVMPTEPEPPKREDKSIDDLIDETFETDQPMTWLLRMAEQPILAQVTPVATSAQPEVNVMVTPGGIVLQSDDPEALAKLEELIRMLSDETVLGRIDFKEYYLINTTASVVQSALNNLLGTNTSESVTGVASVDLPEWQLSEMAGLVAQGNAIEKTGTVTISADERLNVLFVQANAVDHKTIDRLIKILDQPSRDDIMNRPIPRPIKLMHMRAEDARASVERVYANRMQGGGNRTGQGGGTIGGGNQPQGQRGQQPPGQQPNPMMGGGMGGGMGGQMPQGLQQMIQAIAQGGRGGGGNAREQEPPMTLDVHTATNSLIVSATESMFKEVKAYVEEIDAMAEGQIKIIEPVKLDYVTPAFVQQSLTNLLGNAVEFKSNQQANMPQMGGFGGGMGGFGGGMGGGMPFMNTMGGGMRPGGTFGGGMGGNPFMNMMGGGMRPGGAIGGSMGGNPFMNMMGGGMRPGGTIGGGTIGGGMPNIGGAGQRPGGTIGGGVPNIGGAGQRPGGTIGGNRPGGF